MSTPTRPGKLDWYVKRWVPFDETIEIEGVNIPNSPTAAVMQMQVRLYRDAPGAALIDLAATTSGQGISLSVTTTNSIPTTTIRIQINEATIENLLPFPGSGVEPGGSVELVWDLLITATGFKKARWFEGAFIIVPGATQA